MQDSFKASKTDLGYAIAVPRPTQQELDRFYRETYYREGVTSTYHVSYTNDELAQKRLRADCVVELLAQNLSPGSKVRFLEIGCGEGFVVKSAQTRGWDVTGVDYQSSPVKAFNPEVVDRVVAEDPNAYLDRLVAAGEKREVLVLQNVLEHVLQPEDLLRKLQALLSDDGCLLVQVPNDFSALQDLAATQGRIDREYWFLPPQHLNYFNESNLPSVAKSGGFEIVDGITDFPIEIYLWGDEKNYTTDQAKGKFAHQARVSLDLFFARDGLLKYLAFYRAAFGVGLGRNICAVLKKAHQKR